MAGDEGSVLLQLRDFISQREEAVHAARRRLRPLQIDAFFLSLVPLCAIPSMSRTFRLPRAKQANVPARVSPFAVCVGYRTAGVGVGLALEQESPSRETGRSSPQLPRTDSTTSEDEKLKTPVNVYLISSQPRRASTVWYGQMALNSRLAVLYLRRVRVRSSPHPVRTLLAHSIDRRMSFQ